MKNWIKSFFCKHDWVEPDPLRGFFGIITCSKCGKFASLPDEQMTTTTIEFPPIVLSDKEELKDNK